MQRCQEFSISYCWFVLLWGLILRSVVEIIYVWKKGIMIAFTGYFQDSKLWSIMIVWPFCFFHVVFVNEESQYAEDLFQTQENHKTNNYFMNITIKDMFSLQRYKYNQQSKLCFLYSWLQSPISPLVLARGERRESRPWSVPGAQDQCQGMASQLALNLPTTNTPASSPAS